MKLTTDNELKEQIENILKFEMKKQGKKYMGIRKIEKQDGNIKVFPIENIESIELQIEVKDE